MVNPIYRKTDAGHDEIKSRARKLDHKLRALLLIVNGERRQKELLAQVGGMGVGPEAFDILLEQQLIDVLPETQATQAAQPPRAPLKGSNRAPAAAEDSNLFSLYSMRRVEPPQPAAEQTASNADRAGQEEPTHSAEEIQAYQRLYHFYTDIISQHLGLRGYVMQVKVEKATDLPALIALRDPLHAALLKAKGDITARAITEQLDQIVNSLEMGEKG
jgi:hypothetical protein